MVIGIYKNLPQFYKSKLHFTALNNQTGIMALLDNDANIIAEILLSKYHLIEDPDYQKKLKELKSTLEEHIKNNNQIAVQQLLPQEQSEYNHKRLYRF